MGQTFKTKGKGTLGMTAGTGMFTAGGRPGSPSRGEFEAKMVKPGPVHRTIALRTTSAGGRVESILTGDGGGLSATMKAKKLKNDQYEALREIEMQNKQLKQAEEQLRTLCRDLKIDAEHLLNGINSNLSVS